MTASTPPLVDVIAGAIAEHQQDLDQTACPTGYCNCSERFSSNAGHEIHQAHAVLDALTKAGGVEWATEHVGQGSRTIEIHPCDSEADAQGQAAYYGGRIVTRPSLPWAEVEGS